jgi:hypothetical protein
MNDMNEMTNRNESYAGNSISPAGGGLRGWKTVSGGSRGGKLNIVNYE